MRIRASRLSSFAALSASRLTLLLGLKPRSYSVWWFGHSKIRLSGLLFAVSATASMWAISLLLRSPQMAQARWDSARTSVLMASGICGRLLLGLFGQGSERYFR